MARFILQPQPEDREWARALLDGPAAAEQPLLRFRERMDREGDAEDRYAAGLKLLDHYCDHGPREQALAVAEELERLDLSELELRDWFNARTAELLIFGLQEYQRAELHVERALDDLHLQQDQGERGHLGAWLLGLKLETQVARKVEVSELLSTLQRVNGLLQGTFMYPEFLATLRKLADTAELQDDLVPLLSAMWAGLAVEYKFHGRGDLEPLCEIESLLSKLGVRPQRDLP